MGADRDLDDAKREIDELTRMAKRMIDDIVRTAERAIEQVLAAADRAVERRLGDRPPPEPRRRVN